MEIGACIALGKEPIGVGSLCSDHRCCPRYRPRDVRARGGEVHRAFDNHGLIGIYVHCTLLVDAGRLWRGRATLSGRHDYNLGTKYCAARDVGYCDVSRRPARWIQDGNETGIVALRLHVCKVEIQPQLCRAQGIGSTIDAVPVEIHRAFCDDTHVIG